MVYDKEKITEVIESALSIPLKRVLIGRSGPIPEQGPLKITEESSITLTTSGLKNISFFSAGKWVNAAFEPGDILLTEPDACILEQPDDTPVLTIGFHKEFLRCRLVKGKEQTFLHIPYINKEGIDSLVNSLLFYSQQTEISSLIAQALRLAIHSDVIKWADHSRSHDASPFTLLFEMIRQGALTGASRENIAKQTGLHPARISRIIQNRYQSTFNDFINQIRLHRAKLLLSRSRMPIHQISRECGFRYTNYFIRVFRKACKDSPLSYRKKNTGIY